MTDQNYSNQALSHYALLKPEKLDRYDGTAVDVHICTCRNSGAIIWPLWFLVLEASSSDSPRHSKPQVLVGDQCLYWEADVTVRWHRLWDKVTTRTWLWPCQHTCGVSPRRVSDLTGKARRQKPVGEFSRSYWLVRRQTSQIRYDQCQIVITHRQSTSRMGLTEDHCYLQNSVDFEDFWWRTLFKVGMDSYSKRNYLICTDL